MRRITPTTRNDWISETFVVDRSELANAIALHLDFGILPQEPVSRLLGSGHLSRLKAFHVDANRRAVQFLNIVSAKYANPTLQDLMTEYFVATDSLRGYVKPEVGELTFSCNRMLEDY
jgi:hypothetical protein